LCGWQVKLCDPLAIGPYLSDLRDEVHDEVLYKLTLFTSVLLYSIQIYYSLLLYISSYRKIIIRTNAPPFCSQKLFLMPN